jgi:quinol monooxygenase YgiN
MFVRQVLVCCQPGRVDQFIDCAGAGLRYYRGQPGCRGVHLWRSRSDRAQLLALSIWERESDLVAARTRPEYQLTMARVAECYSAPQAVSEWEVLEF